jgi:NAD(P)-dependent dehydrogenase (short-subunit alcohol dehydrogenase family)
MDLGLTDRAVMIASSSAADRQACRDRLTSEGAGVIVVDQLADAVVGIEQTVREFGRIDGVVMYLLSGDTQLLDASVADLYSSWAAVEFVAAAFRAAAPTMIEQGIGRLVSVIPNSVKWLADQSDELGSMAGLGVLGMHKAAVADLARHGISVNAVLRGDVDDVDEVAATIAFMLSKHAGYMQGVTIALDGARSPALF